MLDLPEVDIEKELEAAEKETPNEVETKEPESKEVETKEVETKEPETKEAEKVEAKEPKLVPLAALHEARNEVKELRERLRRKEAEDNQRFTELKQRLEPPAEKPTFDTDPFAYLKNEVESVKQQSEQLAAQTKQQQIENFFTTSLNSSEESFGREHPDYSEATRHLIQTMSKNMELMGQPADANTIKQEIFKVTASALRAGKEPAEVLYELSRNLGFQSKKSVSNSEKIEKISKGQEASTSLGSGSKSDAGTLSLDSLSRMDDEEFDALISNEKKWAQIGKMMH